MATRSEIETGIKDVLRESNLMSVDAQTRMNNAVTRIAAGVRLRDGRTTPPLPDLYSTATVATSTSNAYASLDATYQRNLFMVVDDDKEIVPPPKGGSYYSFQMFLRRARYYDLSETGSIYMCCVKGSNLYYQGKPSTSEDLLTYFYRKPVDMAADSDTPDGLPDPFQLDLVKHFVCRDVYGEHVGTDLKAATGDKMFKRFEYHNAQLEKTLIEMVEFVGEEGEPIYFHSDDGDY